jgi:hypothetical protein
MLTQARHPHTFDTSQELFPVQAFIGPSLERLKSATASERGAVYTRAEVVDFMLDLIGYTPDRSLWEMRLLEPSFGGGEFLFKALERLLTSAARENIGLDQLRESICGVELHGATFEATKAQVLSTLCKAGASPVEAAALTRHWLKNDDFLLAPLTHGFDFVIGNPPYLRQELIPEELLSEYRQRYTTLYDRADLYVPFMERSMQLLGKQGRLSFICSDRWMKNRYGGPLRHMIADGYTLRYYVDMVGTAAFQSEVVAYPAITVIEKGKSAHKVRTAYQPEISSEALAYLCSALKGKPSGFNGTVSELAAAPQGEEPWLLDSDAQASLALVRHLEAAFPTLQEVGCVVGIGVATGADRVFIAPFEELDVETARKLPLVTTRDIQTGAVKWQGLGVVNPFEDDGRLADFERYPRFASYLLRHQELLSKRHCAQRANGSWYRTIDRITPSLAKQPKLLIPDIKGEANIVLDESGLYPHHNLYYITSTEWPLLALQRVLLSGIARLFVRAYSTKMRGGCLRFQAQYLRRIRLPHWKDVPATDKQLLTRIGNLSATELQAAVLSAFQLQSKDLIHLTD